MSLPVPSKSSNALGEHHSNLANRSIPNPDDLCLSRSIGDIVAAVDCHCDLITGTIGAKDSVKNYHMNTFVFTSIPDFWSINHLFPIFPIFCLDGKPTMRGILSDLTCDSDGKIDKFIGGESSFPLHELEGLGRGYYLGMFLGKAYKEALGGLHNLYGDPSVVKLLQSDSPHMFAVTQAVAGPSYANVVRVMHHEPQLMFDVADRWLLNEGLPISFREQFMQFVLQNSGQKDIIFYASFCDLNLNNQGMRFDPGARTALAFVTLRSDGEREFMFYRNPSADMLLQEDELDLGLIRKAKIFHYGLISLITTPFKSAHIATAKDVGVFLSYDPNWRLPLGPSADTVDIIKISEEENSFLTSGTVDTTGAGDTFVAEILSQLATDLSLLQKEEQLRESLKFAKAGGALTVTRERKLLQLITTFIGGFVIAFTKGWLLTLVTQWDPGIISPFSYLFSNLEDKVHVNPAAMIESRI